MKKRGALLFCLYSFLVACGNLEKALDQSKGLVFKQEDLAPRYSENPQWGVLTDRNYKRWTRSRMEEESELGASAGSAWVMEGQGAYLFSQNKTRREGDALLVKLDGASLKQVETKISVIKKLLKQLEDMEKEKNAARGLASSNKSNETPSPAIALEAPKKSEKEEKAEAVQSVPSRIVEKLSDGNYRIKGIQPLMIDQKEYRVIVTGILRPEDFNEEGVSSEKVMDSQIDVMSVRKVRQ